MKSDRYRPASTSGANCVRLVSLSAARASWFRRPHSSRGARLRRSAESAKRLRRHRSKAAWSAGEAGGQTRCSSSATSAAMLSMTCAPKSGGSSSAARAPAANNAAASRTAPRDAKGLAMAPGIRLARRLQIIRDEVLGELAPHCLAHVHGIPEVDATPDAHLFVLFRHLREAVEAALQARVACVGYGKALGPGSEDGFENASRGTRIDRCLSRIFRMHRRRIEWQPAGVALGGVIAVLIAVADRRERPPGLVVELRVPVEDVAVGDAHGEQR